MSYANVKNYIEQGGEKSHIGGELCIDSGGKITAAGTQANHIADQKTDYDTGDLDTEAEQIAAFNATNTAINAILAALEGTGILKTS
jgi:hypothetical protein